MNPAALAADDGRVTTLGEEFARALDAARDGSEWGFVELFRSVQPALLRYLGALAGPLAEDVAAETWLRVVHDLGRFEGDESGFRAWVFTIARHRWLDARRAAARRPPEVYDGGEALAEVPSSEVVADAVEEAVTTEAALQLIATLPPDQAEAVLLRVVAGLDVDRVAVIMGKRPGHVRVLCHRGLRRLAALVGQDHDLQGHVVTQRNHPTVGRV